MRPKAFGTLLATAVIAAANPAIAADGGDGGPRCTERSFASDDMALRLGRATGAGRTHLLGDGTGRLGPGAACRSTAFAAPGQALLLGPSRPGYVCAFVAGRMPGNVGWIPVARLAASTQPIDPTPPLASWLGRWRLGDDTIVLTAEGDQISAEGDAYWPDKHIMPANEGAFA